MAEKILILLFMTLVCSVVGGTLIYGSLHDADWIFNSRKYRLWVKLLGRTTMRIVVGIVGCLILMVPAYLYFYK